MLLSKKFGLFWVVLSASIITALFIDNGLSAQEQSPNSTVTIKLKVLSESMNADDITEIRKLIKAGANVNVINNKYSVTPLYMASKKGLTEIVKLLLEAGADMNAKDEDGNTTLISASRRGHLGIVQLLIDKGADVNAKNKYGYTALINVSSSGHLGMVQSLIDKGADVNAKNKYGDTAITVASRNGHNEVVKMLLDKGADAKFIVTKRKDKKDDTKRGLVSPVIEAEGWNVR